MSEMSDHEPEKSPDNVTPLAARLGLDPQILAARRKDDLKNLQARNDAKLAEYCAAPGVKGIHYRLARDMSALILGAIKEMAAAKVKPPDIAHEIIQAVSAGCVSPIVSFICSSGGKGALPILKNCAFTDWAASWELAKNAMENPDAFPED